MGATARVLARCFRQFETSGARRSQTNAWRMLFGKRALQPGETVAIFLEHSREFQSESAAGLYVTHDGFGPDLSFLDKKMKDGLRSHNFELPRLKKEASGA